MLTLRYSHHQAAKKSATTSSKTSENGGSTMGTGTNTPMTSLSANGSVEDLGHAMSKSKLDVDRSGSGVLTSDPKSRDVHVDSYTLSFHGRLLIENASLALNYGQRYGLLGENGSGKVCR
jgi:ATP-binding cassette subfamily F protein 2